MSLDCHGNGADLIRCCNISRQPTSLGKMALTVRGALHTYIYICQIFLVKPLPYTPRQTMSNSHPPVLARCWLCNQGLDQRHWWRGLCLNRAGSASSLHTPWTHLHHQTNVAVWGQWIEVRKSKTCVWSRGWKLLLGANMICPLNTNGLIMFDLKNLYDHAWVLKL